MHASLIDIHAILSRVGAPLVVRIDAALRAEEMLRCSGVEAIACQHILAFDEPNAA
jgi:hypothetical protein